MRLTGESKFLLGILLGTVVIIGIAVFFLSRPTKPLTRQELIPSGTNTFGSASASSYLVEFSDFQCPACGAFEPTVQKIIKENQDKLLFAYRHFPLPQHQAAIPAARAAEAAGLQGKFWEMHKLLFDNQTKLDDSLYLDLARQLGLNLDKFQTDLQSSPVNDRVTGDSTAGNRIGINSTPTFFLNGSKINPINPQDLEKIVAEALK